MNPQTQNTNSNYDFILSQPGPGPEAPKKSSKRKLIIVAGGVTVLVLVLVGFLGRVTQNVAPNTGTAEQATGTVQQYLTAMGAAQYEQAFNVTSIASSEVAPNKAEFIATTGPFLNSVYAFSDCKLMGTIQAEQQYQTVADCPYRTGEKSEKFLFVTSQVNGTTKVVAVTNPNREDQS